jgi:hypothetical protein
MILEESMRFNQLAQLVENTNETFTLKWYNADQYIAFSITSEDISVEEWAKSLRNGKHFKHQNGTEVLTTNTRMWFFADTIDSLLEAAIELLPLGIETNLKALSHTIASDDYYEGVALPYKDHFVHAFKIQKEKATKRGLDSIGFDQSDQDNTDIL